MTISLFPDTEGALRTWLRNLSELDALIDNRVFFGLPDNVVFPCLTVKEVGGGPEDSEAPVTNPIYQIDCWGQDRNKAQAAQLKNIVVGALHSLQSGTLLDPTTSALGAYGITSVWLPDPKSNQARYAVTAFVSTKYKAA